jgi:small-conductance mechanosensitive channel
VFAFWKSRLISLVLLLLALLAGIGLFLTRDTGAPVVFTAQRRPPIVDEKPVQTARGLVPLATTRDEQRFAQQALTLSDHEVDLAFNYEMRLAKEHPAPPTAETKELYGRVSRAEAQVKDDQELIDQLKKASTAKGAHVDELQQQMALIQAQLELDQDELENAQQNLRRSGVDRLSRVQRQFGRYQAAQQGAPQGVNFTVRDAAPPAPSLLARVVAWRALRGKIRQLQDANTQAQQGADDLQKQREKFQSQSASSSAPESAPQPTEKSSDSSQSVIDSLRRLSADQKDLSDLARRMQDYQELATVYSNWVALAFSQQRSVLHSILLSLLWIILIVLATNLASQAISHFIPVAVSEHTRLRTLRLILRFSVQAVGVLLVLFVVFGIPSQTSTIIGLATAGLTIALKDFIVAFVGWFVLIGRNGVRVGDWVEINGVVGEVVEITLMRTVILETGNWTDIGHPTGRKVTFMNSYAIEGHFFNFSTAGQWLWDEIELVVPADRDPYPVLDAIQKIVTRETDANVRAAEQEWKNATNRYAAQAISAAPAINLKPTGSSVEVHVRYITRANERFAVRTRLYKALVDLLHRKEVPSA